MTRPLPGGYSIEIEVRILREEEVLEHGVLLIGETGETKEFRLAGLAAQRGVYELLQTLWQRANAQRTNDLH